jgi:hypothetical protein
MVDAQVGRAAEQAPGQAGAFSRENMSAQT